MAETSEVIRYVVEIDTSTAEAKIKQLGETGQKEVKDDIDPGKEADNVLDILKGVQTRMRAGAIAGMAFAQTPGQAIAAGGAAVGGDVGTFIAAIGTLADKFQSLAEDLSMFDAGIFEATTGMQFFMMGWKIELAEGISDVMGDLYSAFQDFMMDILPVVIDLFRIMGPILSNIIRLFGILAKPLELLGDSVDYVNEQAGSFMEEAQSWFAEQFTDIWGMVTGFDIDSPEFKQLQEQQRDQIIQGRTFTETLSEGTDQLLEMIGAMERTTEAYEAMQRGFDISRASLTALEEFGYLGLQQGPQLGEAPPAVQHAEGGGGQDADATSRSFPRPAPAAVNFRVSDQINIQGGDETQVLAEMMVFMQNVMSMLDGLHAGQWTRLAEARMGGYMAKAG